MEQPKPIVPLLGTIEGLKRGSTLAVAASRPIATGFAALDRALGGGLPASRLTEVLAGACGRASFLMSVAAQATARGGIVAWIDPGGAFDVPSAVAAGVDLDRVLWIRPQGIIEAVRAADLLLGSDGFMLAILDLWGVRFGGGRVAAGGGRQRRLVLDATAWNRLAKRAEACGVTLLVAADRPLASSAASLVLGVRLGGPRWEGGAGDARGSSDAERSAGGTHPRERANRPPEPMGLCGASLAMEVRHRKGAPAGFTAECPLELP